MRRRIKILIWLGIGIVAVSLLGVPGSWKTFANILLGVAVVADASLLLRMFSKDDSREKVLQPYVENGVIEGASSPKSDGVRVSVQSDELRT